MFTAPVATLLCVCGMSESGHLTCPDAYIYIFLTCLSPDAYYGYPSFPHLINFLSMCTISIAVHSEHGGCGTLRFYP